MTNPTAAFLSQSRHYLTEDYLPKIRAAVEKMSDEDLWWTPNSKSNSVGVLLLHLSGNLGQWIVSSVGGREDGRRRDLEFAPETRPSRKEMLERLGATVADADRVLADLDPAILDERRKIQARDVTCFEAIYHAVEHFSMHTGQILYISKLRSGEDLRFYEMVDGVPVDRWRSSGG